MSRLFSLALLTSLVVSMTGCSDPPPPTAPSSAARPASRKRAPVAAAAAPTGGSSDGPTCEDAIAQNNDEVAMGKAQAADLTSEDLGAVLNQGSYLNECEVPSDSEVAVCAAVQNGRAVGVTVAMRPANPDVERCVAGRVRALGYPSHPKLDVARTTFH